MMGALVTRAEMLGKVAVRRRLDQLAAELRLQGVKVKSAADRISFGGRALSRRWISEPALRFIGRTGQ